MTHGRAIDNSIYTRRAFAATREAYSPYCSVTAKQRSDGLVVISVSVRPEHSADARRIVLEFWNYFLDTTAKERAHSD